MALPSLRNVFPVFFKAGAQIRGLRPARGIPGGNHDIDGRQVVLMHAKGFTGEPFDDITRHGGAQGARGNGQSQPRTVLIVGQYRQTEIGVGEFFAALPYGTEFRRLVQTLARLEGQSLD